MTAPNRPTTSLPCPPWCSLPLGHGFHGYDPNTGEVIRGHSREMTNNAIEAAAAVSIDQEEHAAGDEGPLFDSGPVVIHLDAGTLGDLTGPQARQLAKELLDAADLWDTLSQSMMGR